jgi:hypothetical protein
MHYWQALSGLEEENPTYHCATIAELVHKVGAAVITKGNLEETNLNLHVTYFTLNN